MFALQPSKAKESVRDKYQKKGHGESNPQILISVINNKLQQLNTLPRSHRSSSFSSLTINTSDEYSSAALIYSWAHREERCLFYNWGRAEGRRFAHKYTVYMISTIIWNAGWVFFTPQDLMCILMFSTVCSICALMRAANTIIFQGCTNYWSLK